MTIQPTQPLLGYLSEHTGPDGPFKWQFSKTFADVYRDTALRIIPVYEPLAAPTVAAPDLTDEQIVAALESTGIRFQRFIGGISGTKDCWSTSGSQDVRKLAAGVRAVIAADRAARAATPTQEPTIPIELWGEVHEVPIPVHAHITSLHDLVEHGPGGEAATPAPAAPQPSLQAQIDALTHVTGWTNPAPNAEPVPTPSVTVKLTCTRSHPHDDMNPGCEVLTVKARADNLARRTELAAPQAVEQASQALGYATSLAKALHSKHYSDVMQWAPLPGLLGVLTQIDNMVSGLAPKGEWPARSQRERLTGGEVRDAFEATRDRYSGLDVYDWFEKGARFAERRHGIGLEGGE